MASGWERSGPGGRERDAAEIEVEARPVVDRQDAAAARAASAAHSVDAARRGARLLRVGAWFIAAVGVIGQALNTFWTDDQGFPAPSVRQQLSSLLTFVWVPVAIAAVVYAIGCFLALHATRAELEIARLDQPIGR